MKITTILRRMIDARIDSEGVIWICHLDAADVPSWSTLKMLLA